MPCGRMAAAMEGSWPPLDRLPLGRLIVFGMESVGTSSRPGGWLALCFHVCRLVGFSLLREGIQGRRAEDRLLHPSQRLPAAWHLRAPRPAVVPVFRRAHCMASVSVFAVCLDGPFHPCLRLPPGEPLRQEGHGDVHIFAVVVLRMRTLQDVLDAVAVKPDSLQLGLDEPARVAQASFPVRIWSSHRATRRCVPGERPTSVSAAGRFMRPAKTASCRVSSRISRRENLGFACFFPLASIAVDSTAWAEDGIKNDYAL